MNNFEEIARPYARAAFEFAKQHNQIEQWATMLAVLANMVEDAKLQQALISPRYTRRQQEGLLVQLSGDMLDAHGRNFIALLAENNRLLALPAIFREYTALHDKDAHELEVELLTARPLASSLQPQLVAALEKNLKVHVQLRQRVDPALIGGAQLRIGDQVIDASVLGKLQRLAGYLHLKENPCP